MTVAAIICICILSILSFPALGSLGQAHFSSGEIEPAAFKNIVVIPDIHGDELSFIQSLWLAFVNVERSPMVFDEFKAIMLASSTGLPVSKLLSAAPADTVLVQIGDVIDRGPDGLTCLSILGSIEQSIGWKTIRLYGNHELMSHLNKSRSYIHEEEFVRFSKVFGTRESRISEFSREGSVWSKISSSSLMMARLNPSSSPFLDSDSLLPASSSSTLFVHGGAEIQWMTKLVGNRTGSVVGTINQMVHEMLTTESGASNISLLEERQTPLWIRDLAEMDDEYVCERALPKLLKFFNVARIIVGHTPQTDKRMKSLCGSRLILADSAMSKWMRLPANANSGLDEYGDSIRGNPSALVMKQADGELTSMEALYYDSILDLVRKETLFDAEQALPHYTGRIAMTDPSVVLTQPIGRSGNSVAVTYQVQGTAVQMHGGGLHAMMLSLKHAMNQGVSFAIPRIVFISRLRSPAHSEFTILLEAHGFSLRSMNHITLPVARQVLEAYADLWKMGFTIRYSPRLNHPRDLLELFVFDAESLLVKLTDFTTIQYRDERSLFDVIRDAVNELSHLTNVEPTGERVDYRLLMTEVFEMDASLIPDSYFSPTTTPPPSTTMLAVQGAAEDPLADIWGVQDLTLSSRSVDSWVFRVQLRDGSVLGRKEAVILALHPIVAAEAMDSAALATSAFPIIPGIPLMLAVMRQPGAEGYLAFDLDPNLVMPVNVFVEPGNTPHDQRIVHGILATVVGLHANGVSLQINNDVPGLAWSMLARFFFVNSKSGDIWLVDFSGARPRDMASSENSLTDELDCILLTLEEIFPTVVFDDPSDTFLSGLVIPARQRVAEKENIAANMEGFDYMLGAIV